MTDLATATDRAILVHLLQRAGADDAKRLALGAALTWATATFIATVTHTQNGDEGDLLDGIWAFEGDIRRLTTDLYVTLARMRREKGI
jgi:hypothetical protein